ncbi:HlyD family secretion protein [Litorilituus lipolyticus]|uniref:HlyD family efflux transporter periplasmic adaptor subunit n=1 Tax=Litorilituus lipolyticus TaxID=2491017 RepID=A0A502L5M9_9GAMM|nr:HlyD family efflux transporter periplasmic adaptor subunit [Litorilituus lipolyticus]TPH15617.1 HlyD family efflux transporter periplasmic adaptor subunit [Litorilituus lipolyticus]
MNKLTIVLVALVLQACQTEPLDVGAKENSEVVVTASGELESEKTAMIAPPSISRMWQYQIKFLMPENSEVKKGDLLASFDDKKVTDRLTDKQAELARAQKELDNKKIKEVETEQELILLVAEKEMEFEKAKRKAEIVDNSRSDNDRKKAEIDFTIAENDLFLAKEKLKYQLDNKALNLKLAQGKVERLTSEVNNFKRDIERLKVKAPMDGMVIYKADWQGEKPAVGESVQFGQPIIELAVREKMQVKAQIEEPDSGKIKVGQKVKITLDGTQELVTQGRVASLGRVFRDKSFQDKRRVLDVIINFDEIDTETMRPGMTARVEVVVEQGDVLAVVNQSNEKLNTASDELLAEAAK